MAASSSDDVPQEDIAPTPVAVASQLSWMAAAEEEVALDDLEALIKETRGVLEKLAVRETSAPSLPDSAPCVRSVVLLLRSSKRLPQTPPSRSSSPPSPRALAGGQPQAWHLADGTVAASLRAR